MAPCCSVCYTSASGTPFLTLELKRMGIEMPRGNDIWQQGGSTSGAQISHRRCVRYK